MFTVGVNFTLTYSIQLAFALFIVVFEIFLFSVRTSRKICPSARCVSTASIVHKHVAMFDKQMLMFKHVLKQYLCVFVCVYVCV
jgi:hypothetical protein